MSSGFQSLCDEDLACQTQAGSLAAFEELVYRYEKRVYGFIANSCAKGTDARELTQDTFVRAFQAINQFDARYAFAPWLFTIARHKCIDAHRVARPAAEALSVELTAGEDPAELTARADERQHLWGLARRLLPTIQFQALWLKYVEDLDLAGIAQSLNKSRTHTKVLLFRARRALGRELEKGGQWQTRSPGGHCFRPPAVDDPSLKRLRLPAI